MYYVVLSLIDEIEIIDQQLDKVKTGKQLADEFYVGTSKVI